MEIDYVKLPVDQADLLLSMLKEIPWKLAQDPITLLLNAEKVMKVEVKVPEVV